MNGQQTLWHNLRKSWMVADSVPLPDDEHPVLVQAECSLVSLGTERLVVSEPLLTESAQRMRIPYMQGSFCSDFTFGYSLVGRVIDGPDALKDQRVHLLHPHQQYAMVKMEDVFTLPESLTTENAMLISNMETAVTACWDAEPAVGDSILIIGYGIIGALLATLLDKIPGVKLNVCDSNGNRAELAKEAGYPVCANPRELDSTFDIVFNTAANSAALQSAIDVVRFEGLVVELSWHGARSTEVKLGGSFHYDRKRLIASQVSVIPAAKQSFWNANQRKTLVAELLASMDTSNILNRSVPFDQAPDFFNQLRQHPADELGIFFTY